MPPILYPAKMFSFSNQMSYSKNVVDTLESLCRSNALLYVSKAFESHIWYLTEECAVFSLFSNQLRESEQQDIVLRLNRTLVPSSTMVRHDFQCLTTQQSSLTSLVPKIYYCSTDLRLTLTGSPSSSAAVAT